MTLLSLDDPVFVVDLTPSAVAAGRADFLPHDATAPADLAPSPPEPPAEPIRAMALVFDPADDPVLVPVSPTTDTTMLDAVARLLRAAMVLQRSVTSLVRDGGDAHMQRMHRDRRMPRFVYAGFDGLPCAHRIPAALRRQVP